MTPQEFALAMVAVLELAGLQRDPAIMVAAHERLEAIGEGLGLEAETDEPEEGDTDADDDEEGDTDGEGENGEG